MSEINVCIIDTHVLVRQIISSIIREEKDISVASCLSGEDEQEVLDAVDNYSPDVVFIGIDEADSPSQRLFLKLRKMHPLLPVVVVTPLNKPGGEIAIDALKKGAVEFITKPERGNCLTLSANHFAKRVVPVIRATANINMESMQRPLLSEQIPGEEFPDYSLSPFYNFSDKTELVVIGGCTGGVRSLYKVISSLPVSFPVPVIIVQHMPKIYSEVLSEDLDRYSPLKVSEAKNNSVLLPGKVYLAPGGYHTTVKSNTKRKTISLYRGPKVHRARPSVDVLFWSTARTFREKALGVLLSGEGQDGIEGARYIRNHGGKIITESKRSSVLWELPERADRKISQGRYDAEKLGAEICRRVLTMQPAGLVQSKSSAASAVENLQI